MPFPCMESPRCFISSIGHDVRLECDSSGKLSTTRKRMHWAEWKIVELQSNENVLLQSASHGHFLYLDEAGQLSSTKDEKIPTCKWSFKPSPHGGLFIISASSQKNLGCYGKDVYTSKNQSGARESWKLEFLSGELCFMSLPEFDKRLTCDVFGKLSATTKWKGWEVWRFIEIGGGDVIITSWTHKEKVLCSNGEGHVFTTEKETGSGEMWRVERAPSDDGVVISSVSHNRRLGFDGETFFTANAAEHKFINWHLEAAHKHKYHVSICSNGERIECGGMEVFLSSPKNKEPQEWLFESAGDGLVTLFSSRHNKYLSSKSNGEVALAESISGDEHWQINESKDGGAVILSKVHGRKLSSNDKKQLCTVLENDSCSSTWHLGPCMPETITGKQMWIKGLGIAVGAAATVAAPFAVMGAVGAMGFTAGGIASGSVAAGMMSAEAIAAGGGVVAGGTVATLQSIGAAGLGFAGTSAALSAGALVGGSIAGATGAMAHGAKEKVTLEGGEQSNKKRWMKRPFCDWRSWSPNQEMQGESGTCCM
eukprot:CAMPEP_0185725084 /NCGR_PEP_ID=MMETSP1171-20130828/1407_1 /TAXON_ID=374046 /ORGANISM="Helicotheca tamensis, Strain CCMP826" /LENGTH=537 /DNA_ID=CAMNT_0028393105 /DNA_START=225 /DNA_END=1838 /DNA_ORIENTATION=-